MKVTCHFTKIEEIEVHEVGVIFEPRYPQYPNFVNDAWSQRDIESMIKGYEKVKRGQMTVKEVAKQMGKSYSSLKNKAWRMGISHDIRG